MSGPFVHLGVLYADPEDLVTAVLPRLRAALDAGDDVIAVLDRRTTALLREGLDDRAERVTFRAPPDLLRPGSDRLITELRALGGRARGTRARPFVLGQYQGFTTTDDASYWEAAATLVLDDQRLTLVCACPRGADPALVDIARSAHSTLLTGSGIIANPIVRTPPDRSPTPSAMWGRRALRLSFRGPADLARIRERVARVAAGAGLGSERSAAAVLAVHEAALLVCGGRELDRDDCTLEVRESERAVLAEITGPGPVARGAAPLRYVELFSEAATLAEHGDRHTVRVLTTAGPPLPA